MFAKQVNDFNRGRLSQITNISFISDSQNQNARCIETFTSIIQNSANTLNDVMRHLFIDLTCCLNKDTVTSNTWSWIKSRETIGFCSGSRNNFPHIYTEKVCHHGQFIDQAYIYRAEGILEKFHKFCRTSRADRNNRIYNCFIEYFGQLCATRSDACDDFWRIPQTVMRITRIDTLW